MRVLAIATVGLGLMLASAASAAELHVLHSFCAKSGCTDGNFPSAPLVLDGRGNLYGTTTLGGVHDTGTVYQIDRSGGGHVYHRLFSFQSCGGCAGGINPQAPLMLDADGALYGTAYGGGTRGVGTLFKLSSVGDRWHLHVFHNFCSSSFCSDGSNPISGGAYAQARSGAPYDGKSDVYGVTFAGGQSPYGVLYRWTPKGGEHIARSFCVESNCTDGAQPNGEVAFNDAGYACGTTRAGGNAQHGTLYCLTEGDNSWTYSFCSRANCSDGAGPFAGVASDGNGNLIGTTRYGGKNGQGVVFAISTASDHRERVLHNFCSRANCADGKNPMGGILLIDGAVYGTTSRGGKYDGGTVFRIDASGHQTVLHSFCRVSGCPDGYAPQAGVITDGNGHLFGTTTQGGRYASGTVFELDL
jgi:uncharacterized repeat protein (TIGR03803 family)